MIHFNTVLPFKPRSYELFSFTFPHKNPVYMYILSPIRATWTVYLVLLDLIIREMKTWSSSLFNFLRPLITLRLLYFTSFSVDFQIQSPTSTAVLYHYPQDSFPTLSLAIHTSSGVSSIESFIEISLSQFHCVTAHKFWLHLNFLCTISFTFKVMSEINSYASQNGFLASCYIRSFLRWQEQPHLGVFMVHGPTSINMLSYLVIRVRNRGGAVNVIPRLRAGRPRNRGSILGRCNRFSSFKICQDRH